MCGYVKYRVYADNPQTMHQQITILAILPKTYRKVIGNKLKRIRAFKRLRGGHLNDIKFPYSENKCISF